MDSIDIFFCRSDRQNLWLDSNCSGLIDELSRHIVCRSDSSLRFANGVKRLRLQAILRQTLFAETNVLF